MTIVGVRDLRDKLAKYLALVKRGGQVIVTERGKPFAILHDLKNIDVSADQDEVLASLAAAGKLRLPTKPGGLMKYEGATIKGKPLTETIIEHRR